MMAGISHFFRDRSGAAAAEMALMLPLLIALLFVTFEGGYFLWNEHKVVKGVRDGARYASRMPFADFDCTNGTVSDSTVETNIKEVTRTGQLSGGTATVPGWQDADVTVTVSCVTEAGIYASNSDTAPRVRVSAAVAYPTSPLTELVNAWGFGTNIHLNASAQSAVMGV